MRGTGEYRYVTIFGYRFIPARAGNGAATSRQTSRGAVHPRACGERFDNDNFKSARVGSSPRVRGTVWIQPGALLPHRFIPARAGNGVPNPARWSPGSVHPRACGERSRAPIGDESDLRFIPARAGNGPVHPSHKRGRAVHPRACGERYTYALASNTNYGSSPRVRGTVALVVLVDVDLRFIPARAGNG